MTPRPPDTPKIVNTKMERKRDAYEKIMLTIDDRTNYSSKISKELKMTLAHIQRCICELKEEGIIIKTKIKRKRILTLTPKGEKVKQAYIDLNYAYSLNKPKTKP